MKKTILMSLVLAGPAVLADITKEVRCHEIGFSKSAEIRDAKLFTSFIDQDARFVGDSVAKGPVEIADAWSPFFANNGPTIKWRPQFVEVLDDGTLALTRGPYQMIVQNEDGSTTESWGTFNSVWRQKEDGSWKVVFDAGHQGSGPLADEALLILEAGDDCGD